MKNRRPADSGLDRREFMKRTLLGSGVLMLPSEAASAGDKRLASPVDRGRAHLTIGPQDLILGNHKVEFVFDVRSGSIARIAQKVLGNTIEIPRSAAAPMKVWVGTNAPVQSWLGVSKEQPDEAVALISPSTQKLDAYKTFDYPAGAGIELYWVNLIADDGRETGVAIRQRFHLDDASEFVRISTHLINRGSLLLTGLSIGLEGIVLGGEASQEVLTVPTGGMGKRWIDPKRHFADKPLITCVPPTVPQGLVCGWLDLSNPQGGVGIGYLNRRGMDLIGEVSYADHGASLIWRMFRLDGGWEFMSAEKIGSPHQVYPLRPGEEFLTDDWFFGFHAGDWHETASFYRKQYERVFHGDFLSWRDVSPTAKGADLILDVTAAWGVQTSDGYVPDKGIVKNHFAEVPNKARAAIRDVAANPENVLVVMLGQGTHWGIYKLPDYFPANPEAGGQAAFQAMIQSLRQDIGIAGTHFYTHLVFNHPEAANYVPEADTGWNEDLYFNYDAMGRVACLDCEPWFELWKRKIIPEFVESGASGIEVDEGFGHHLTCFERDHLHGGSAESILTAQTRGALRIYRECRRAFGERGYLECEGGSDVYARLVDLWEAGSNGPFEIVRYTHPDKLIVLFASDAESVYRAFVYGMVVLHGISVPAKLRTPLRRYIALRRELRQKGAPGYPYGFKDDRGLSIQETSIVAKAFCDSRGITVAYYSKKAVTAEVIVDARVLAHPQFGTIKRTLTLPANHVGYFILD